MIVNGHPLFFSFWFGYSPYIHDPLWKAIFFIFAALNFNV